MIVDFTREKEYWESEEGQAESSLMIDAWSKLVVKEKRRKGVGGRKKKRKPDAA